MAQAGTPREQRSASAPPAPAASIFGGVLVSGLSPTERDAVIRKLSREDIFETTAETAPAEKDDDADEASIFQHKLEIANQKLIAELNRCRGLTTSPSAFQAAFTNTATTTYSLLGIKDTGTPPTVWHKALYEHFIAPYQSDYASDVIAKHFPYH